MLVPPLRLKWRPGDPEKVVTEVPLVTEGHIAFRQEVPEVVCQIILTLVFLDFCQE
jgi:hypothetical protein